jgi:sarcosine oxidase subunit alpha
MFRRQWPLRDPVTIFLDERPVPAERGEPIAVALLAADRTILARSPKLHRPRGPACFRGACDGCLARVDGAPNVMTCQRAATDGARVETQNVVGSRRADLLRVTDWFFPDGIDHHHLLAGVPGLSDAMQAFARKLAGLGHLPDTALPAHAAAIADVDVAIVGGGLAGAIVAARTSAAGLSTCLVDDGLALGGSLAGLLSPADADAPDAGEVARAAHHLRSLDLSRVTTFLESTAAGFHLGQLLVARPRQAVVVRPRALVIASGAHDGVGAFPNNDLPGVLSARALCRLLARGVVPDGPVALVGRSAWGDAVARALGEDAVVRLAPEEVVAVKGTGGVRSIVARRSERDEELEVAVVATALPGAPAFELAEQAGAEVRCDPGAGYCVVVDERGRAGGALWAAGECTGLPFDADAIATSAERAAADVAEALAISPR